ncbi:MAG: LysR substrate-binding domain-containing protein [Pseudomonadota bacterium]
MRQVISFRHLEALRAVFLAGSVTGAADRLGVTQSAVSHLIRDAEDRLGILLFNRQLGRLAPTKKGELLWGQIQQSFTALEAVNDFCLRLREAENRDIVIASIPTVSAAILPSTIKRFRDTVAGNFFVIWPQNTETAIASARFQTADLSFGVNLEPVPGVESMIVGHFDLLCFLPPGHPLGHKREIASEDLQGLTHISLSDIEGMEQSVEAALDQTGEEKRAAVKCPSAITAAAMVEAGVGYALLDPVTAFLNRTSDIIVRRFTPRVSYTLRAYWPSSGEPHFDRDLFLDLVRERAAAISDPP